MKRGLMIIVSILFATSIFAQEKFLGRWQGTLNASVPVTLIFHIKHDANKNYSITIDCPDQGLRDLQGSNVYVGADSMSVEISDYSVLYRARMISDTVITGTFVQGVVLPLTIKKVDAVAIKKRPQTPVPPFPYKSEDVMYTNADESVTFGATITIPEGKGPFPAVLLITGSGQQNRDEEFFEHRPFAVIADHLTRNGFVVMRVDDRGMGVTTGDVYNATTRDFADDAIVSLNFLLGRNEVDKKKVGLIGHSEGGMIAQMIAAERIDVRFIVLLAAPGVKNSKVMSDQNRAIFEKTGLPKEYVDAYVTLYDAIINTAIDSEYKALRGNIEKVVDDWTKKTPQQIVMMTTGIRDSATKQKFITDFATQLGYPWFKYFLAYDPEPVIKKISADVLALNGSKDIQVISSTNLSGIEKALKQSKSKRYEVKELPGLNHMFQECVKCTVQEYGELEKTFSEEVLNVMTQWMKKQTRD